jgi:hypothetical protein
MTHTPVSHHNWSINLGALISYTLVAPICQYGLKGLGTPKAARNTPLYGSHTATILSIPPVSGEPWILYAIHLDAKSWCAKGAANGGIGTGSGHRLTLP